MSQKKITPAQRKGYRDQAKSELLRLEAIYGREDERKIIDEFKGKFLICEIVYKAILDEHQYWKHGVRADRYTISMKQVPHALKFAGYDFEKSLLDKLFSSENRYGKRSVKNLRDALTHSVKEKDVKELIDRNQELHSYMDSFLDKIKLFDEV